jgi:hypothetical protein
MTHVIYLIVNIFKIKNNLKGNPYYIYKYPLKINIEQPGFNLWCKVEVCIEKRDIEDGIKKTKRVTQQTSH